MTSPAQSTPTVLDQAQRAPQTVTAAGASLRRLIDGVRWIDTRAVVTRNGLVTEVFRPEWAPDFAVRNAAYCTLIAGAASAWHCHRGQSDLVVPLSGHLKVALYDDRPESPTHRQVDELFVNPARPGALLVPPRVWHGIKNIDAGSSAYVVFNDQPFVHEAPDDWVLPPTTDLIPYRLA